MTEKAISVTQINNYIKSIFDAEVMLHGISVFGEITDWNIVRGVAYFTIKDEFSSLQCVAFGADYKFNGIKNGDQVVVTGAPNYYVKGGRFNFNVSKIEPYGQGLLYLQFLKLKEKLEKEGLFEKSTKKELPENIKRIGVVTSKTGAVIQDIINVTKRRNPNVDIVLYPAKVQGLRAAQTIVEGIEFFDSYDKVDAIVVARGGGSMEDLAEFNDELLARCVFKTNKFVLSAVGHETDFTIIDFVSDLRAPTPSAAAELLVKDSMQAVRNVNLYSSKLKNLFENLLERKQNTLELLNQNLAFNIRNSISAYQNNLERLKDSLKNKVQSFITQKEYEISYLSAKFEKLNPESVLKMGYAKIEQEKSVNSIKQLNLEKEFKVIMQDASILAKQIKE